MGGGGGGAQPLEKGVLKFEIALELFCSSFLGQPLEKEFFYLFFISLYIQ